MAKTKEIGRRAMKVGRVKQVTKERKMEHENERAKCVGAKAREEMKEVCELLTKAAAMIAASVDAVDGHVRGVEGDELYREMDSFSTWMESEKMILQRQVREIDERTKKMCEKVGLGEEENEDVV